MDKGEYAEKYQGPPRSGDNVANSRNNFSTNRGGNQISEESLRRRGAEGQEEYSVGRRNPFDTGGTLGGNIANSPFLGPQTYPGGQYGGGRTYPGGQYGGVPSAGVGGYGARQPYGSTRAGSQIQGAKRPTEPRRPVKEKNILFEMKKVFFGYLGIYAILYLVAYLLKSRFNIPVNYYFNMNLFSILVAVSTCFGVIIAANKEATYNFGGLGSILILGFLSSPFFVGTDFGKGFLEGIYAKYDIDQVGKIVFGGVYFLIAGVAMVSLLGTYYNMIMAFKIKDFFTVVGEILKKFKETMQKIFGVKKAIDKVEEVADEEGKIEEEKDDTSIAGEEDVFASTESSIKEINDDMLGDDITFFEVLDKEEEDEEVETADIAMSSFLERLDEEEDYYYYLAGVFEEDILPDTLMERVYLMLRGESQ